MAESHVTYASIFIDKLQLSFMISKKLYNFISGSLSGLKKEDVRSLEGEKDKDEDCADSPTSKKSRVVDLPSVRRAYTALFKLPSSIFENALVNALVSLAGNLQVELQLRRDSSANDDILNVLAIVFEIPALGKLCYDFCYTFSHRKVCSITFVMPGHKDK